MKKKIDENLTKCLIKTSSFLTTILDIFVKKPGKKFRLYVHYKTFNAITIKYKYPLFLIQKTLNRLIKITYFTKLNIVAAFHKIKMVENKKWKTVSRTKYGFLNY